jgi:hypothetical protein
MDFYLLGRLKAPWIPLGKISRLEEPVFFGLKALLLAPLCLENRGIISKGRFDPLGRSGPRQGRKVRTFAKEEGREHFLYHSTPFISALQAAGLPECDALFFAEHIHSVVTGIVCESMGNIGSRREPPIAASFSAAQEEARDNLLPYVFRTLVTLLLWVFGTHASTILKVIHIQRKFQILGQSNLTAIRENFSKVLVYSENLHIFLKKGNSARGSDPFGYNAFSRAPFGAEGDLSHSEDGQAFDRRFSEKIALVLDSYLEYITLKGDRDAFSLQSLKAMLERTRYGMREEEISLYAPYLAKGGSDSREEWLSRDTPFL